MFAFTWTGQNIDRQKNHCHPVVRCRHRKGHRHCHTRRFCTIKKKTKSHHNRLYFDIAYFHSENLEKITDAPPHRRRHYRRIRHCIRPCCRRRSLPYTLPHQKNKIKPHHHHLNFAIAYFWSTKTYAIANIARVTKILATPHRRCRHCHRTRRCIRFFLTSPLSQNRSQWPSHQHIITLFQSK